MPDIEPTGDRWSKRTANCAKTSNAILQALLILKAQVRQKDMAGDDLKLQVETYRRKLIQLYPPSVSLKVLERWPDDSDYWPTWHELRIKLDEELAHQKLMATPRLEAPKAPEPEPDRRTPQQKLAAHDATMAELRAKPAFNETLRRHLLRMGEGIRNEILQEIETQCRA